MATQDNPAAHGAQAFVISHLADAPRELVWQAYTDRDCLMRWFGPKGFTTPVCTLDLRPGGVFHYCMRSAGGQEMWGKWIYRDIMKPERLVCVVSFSDAQGGVTRHPMSPTWPLQTLSTTRFDEQDGKTVITVEWSALEATPEEQKTFDDSHESLRMGCSGTFAQLDAFLAERKKAV